MHLLPSTLLALLLSLSAAQSTLAAGGPHRLENDNARPAHHRSIARSRRDGELKGRTPVVLLPELVNDESKRVYDQAQKRAADDVRDSKVKVMRKRAGVCKQRMSSGTGSATASIVASTSTSTSTTPTSTYVAPTTSSKAMATTPSSSAARTTTSSSVAPTATATAEFITGWTSPESSVVTNLKSVSLATALKSSKGTAPGNIVTTTPDGSTAMEAVYKAGVSAAASGWSFYANYGQTELRAATEAVLTYKVFFASDFDWVKGGKLPGLYGGIENEYGCSGGDQEGRDLCWSARLMWRTNGMGELYTYLPLGDTNVAACKASGHGAICNNETYGLSFGRGNFTWPKGEWVTASERVKLNDVGSNNGVIELTVNGVVVITAKNLNIRTRSDSGFEGNMMSTFFGGSGSEWAPSATQHAWFKDFQIGIIA